MTKTEKRLIDQRLLDIHSGKDKGVLAIAVSKKIRAKLKVIKRKKDILNDNFQKLIQPIPHTRR